VHYLKYILQIVMNSNLDLRVASLMTTQKLWAVSIKQTIRVIIEIISQSH
jgi:hypothetical protein